MLEIKNLSKSYKDIKAVNSINMTIEKGEIVGLLGPNGAGKSTTISMISTLFQPTEGSILYNGKNIVKEPKWIQPHLGYVPQEIALYESLSGYDNLKYFGGLYGLKGSHLKARIKAVSEIIGIDGRLKSDVSTYSGGMKRRINIGVALMHEPEIVIMDEPTVGIDPQSRNHILQTVKRLNEEGVTVIYTSHYMEEVETLCKKIYIMDLGNIIASGTQEELISQSQIHTAIRFKFDRPVSEIIPTMKGFDGVVAVNVESDTEVSLLTGGNGNSHKDIIKSMIALDCGLISFDVIKPDLEQVFLKLTGRGLRD